MIRLSIVSSGIGTLIFQKPFTIPSKKSECFTPNETSDLKFFLFFAEIIKVTTQLKEIKNNELNKIC